MNPWLIGIPAVAAVASGAAAYGAVYPRSQLFGWTTCFTRVPQELAITFDDGPNPAITPRLLDLLDAHRARATFFLIGRFAAECPDLVREIVARRHSVANHTYTHPNLFWCSPARIGEELRQCRDTVAEITGAAPNWFRPPYGFRNPWVVSTAQGLGMATAMWTLIPGDWRARTADWLIPRLAPIGRTLSEPRGNRLLPGRVPGGDILCLHDGSHRGLNADRAPTLAALEYWLPRWRDMGLQFVTIERAVSAPAV